MLVCQWPSPPRWPCALGFLLRACGQSHPCVRRLVHGTRRLPGRCADAARPLRLRLELLESRHLLSVAPSVVSVTPLDANPTAQPTLHFQVKFSEAVLGVDET